MTETPNEGVFVLVGQGGAGGGPGSKRAGRFDYTVQIHFQANSDEEAMRKIQEQVDFRFTFEVRRGYFPLYRMKEWRDLPWVGRGGTG